MRSPPKGETTPPPMSLDEERGEGSFAHISAQGLGLRYGLGFGLGFSGSLTGARHYSTSEYLSPSGPQQVLKMWRPSDGRTSDSAIVFAISSRDCGDVRL